MPHPKIKTENYVNLGGINSKISPYIMGPEQFLNLVNFDFQQPGSLTQRWGTTLYQAQNFTGAISSLYEFSRIDGFSGLVVGTTGALWFGATTGQAQGISFTYQGLTIVLQPQISRILYAAGSVIEAASSQVPLQGDLNKILFPNGSTILFNIASQPLNQNRMDFLTLQNYMFGADGSKFFKFEGTTTSYVGLPPATRKGGPVVNATSVAGLGATGSYALYASYVNKRGFEGPIWLFGTVEASVNGATLAALGGTFILPTYTFYTPLQYDIDKINIYAYWSSITLSVTSATLWSAPYRRIQQTSASGSTTTDVLVGMSLGSGQTLITANAGPQPPLTNYIPLGFTIQTSPDTQYVSEIDINPYFPKYIETYQNRLFSAGFSGALSNIWFSDAGEPEGYEADWNLEVRSNDGDRITTMKAYNSRLYVFKQASFYELTGDNPDNFNLREVSTEYGCLSNRAATVYNDLMLFLDAKGVMRFNGANLECISNPIQSIFDQMNLTAAMDQATMVHDKSRNQVMLGLPINGATFNNITVVYDYLANGGAGAWTKYEGYNPSIYTAVKQRFGVKTVIHGGYSGSVSNAGASLLGDNGSGFTCLLKTRFISNGQSREQQFRRLWVNVNEVTGATSPLNINFYQDYGSSIILNRTMYQTPFQSRIDFGIPAKSLSFELSKFSATLSINFHGFALGYRYQRDV